MEDFDAGKTVATRIAPPTLAEAPYDPSQDRETMRGRLAAGLAVLFAFVVLALLVSGLAGWASSGDLEHIAAIVLSPVGSLLGAVVGFYYGEHSRRR